MTKLKITTIRLPEEVHNRLKIEALSKDISMGEYVERALLYAFDHVDMSMVTGNTVDNTGDTGGNTGGKGGYDGEA